jgi:glycosyltransferase involved in cell wall biosynthesis
VTHVCLIAEGSYPYVTGGVGKWTHDLIASIPEVEFTVVALWPTPETVPPPRYPKLPNIREIRPLFISVPPENKGGFVSQSGFRAIENFHEGLKKGEVTSLVEVCPHVKAKALLHDAGAWDLLSKLYETHAPEDTSFPDYFWTWRATHTPLFRIFQDNPCKADVIHCISTGYAGFLGALHKIKFGAPLVTTEHGLYTRERTMDIWDADWIPGEAQADERRAANLFKGWWKRMFEGMERITYTYSDVVIALFEENCRYQISRGSSAARTRVIPNGVDLKHFDEVRQKRRGPSEKFHVGLVGRIVQIKDIKTFIGACKIMRDRLGAGKLEVSLIGPADEDEVYGAQCIDMVRLLGLQDVVKFVGKTDPRKYYEKLDVVVLTSLSEGQPLVILESMACGVPVVATDVGSCRELLEGRNDEDRALGPAGVITSLADPEETARALIELARQPERARQMGESGYRRVEKHYRLEQVRESYFELYRSLARGRR